jgi:heptosyltransferase II
MKILIEIPSWLGDTVMVTPVIENLAKYFKRTQITVIGKNISCEVLKHHPKVSKTIVLDKKITALYRISKEVGKFDIFFSFRGSIRSKILSYLIAAERKYQFNKRKYSKGHQVEKYNEFINDSIGSKLNPGKLILNAVEQSKFNSKKILGISPGASYGSSKQWYPKEFSEVAIDLSSHYDIIIFGSSNEIDFAKDIEKNLVSNGVMNYKNLVAKTTIKELISEIQNLDLIITGDSGPMHIAAACQIPTVAIFGPTNHEETSQWKNYKSSIVKKNLDCQPCMKRECPLKHNNCMRKIQVSDVLEAVKNLNI